ncbi:MAG: GDSL-type esterase/lipase family protein [Myxococcota bacterium]|nr:GDSL-type esterase/lipase family protein [Myxococcota bacterium]
MAIAARRKAAFALVVTGFALGLGEWAARSTDGEMPQWSARDTPSVVMTGHPSRLWGLAPGERRNVDTVATVDSIGLRAPVPTGARGADEQRVMILGDSSFFGFGVADDQTMAAHLARRLGGATVINGAIPGYSTEQSMRLMDEVGWALDPTLLVVANFWSDTNFEPFSDRDLLRTADAQRSGWIGRSALVRWLAIAVSAVSPGAGGRIVTWPRGKPLPDATERRVPVDAYARNLDALIRAARARGIGVVLFTPPSPVEIEATVRPPHQWEPYRLAQQTVAAAHGIPHIDATAPFAAAVGFAPEKGLAPWFLDDLHPTANGQRLMAKLVDRTLDSRGWPESPLLGKADAELNWDAFVDTTPASRAGRPTGDRSPIANLFSGTDQSGAGAPPSGQSGSPPAAPTAVTVRIAGGEPPYAVTVQSNGATVASARVKEPRSLTLEAPGTPLVVTVTDGAGGRTVAELSAGDRTVNAAF